VSVLIITSQKQHIDYLGNMETISRLLLANLIVNLGDIILSPLIINDFDVIVGF
jgi:hypothetical protein